MTGRKMTGRKMTGGKMTWRKTCSSATLTTTNLTNTDLRSKPDLCDYRQAPKNLSHGTAGADYIASNLYIKINLLPSR